MSKFKELNKNINDTLSQVISSQNLCKLIEYDTYNPLSESDIADTSTLLFNKIFPFPKIPDIQDEENTSLCVLFDNFSTDKRNFMIKEGVLTLLIISHNNLWKINGGIRPFSIMHELDELFVGKRIVGIKELQFLGGRYISFNDKFSGYEIKYRLHSVN